MLTQVGLCIMLMMMLFLRICTAMPASSSNIGTQNKELSDAFMLEQYGVDSNNFLTDRQYEDDHINEDDIFPEKRQLNKKWAKFYQGPQSPYTIAFPALIRTRRWIEQRN
ncbi:unnamed protein product [Rotaria socialis]|uniref:Secreted protein n=1 Tax=Rotaria socialis TaxID=392032 RepID=A0A821QXK2_9BILA|nr:unnamed protein product [Rotaria socialis]CAF3361809.1 unnamed protein product [Rotaria socialis]CAF3461034.1 unnamed protein product [Rotaria socialis]CAF3532770.1 unnamed protein product [Rotaria socialis]CAF3731250.1 unnamed protein product [Rotaria socialis]